MTPRGAPDLLSGYLERRAHQPSRWKRLTQNERVKWIQSLFNPLTPEKFRGRF